MDVRPLFEESKTLFNQSKTIQTLLGEECETEQPTLNELQGAKDDDSPSTSAIQQLPPNTVQLYKLKPNANDQ